MAANRTTLDALLAGMTQEQQREYLTHCYDKRLPLGVESAKRFIDEVIRKAEAERQVREAAERKRREVNAELARLTAAALEAVTAAQKFANTNGLYFEFEPFEQIREEVRNDYGWRGSSC